jgi:predicted AAA+ superfamily ATPase
MLTRSEIEAVLADWNSWDREFQSSLLGRPRALTKEILALATGREVIAITGVRRCGKSTVLYQLMEEMARAGIERQRLLLVNLEDHRLAPHLGTELLDRILAVHREARVPRGPLVVFLDEIQEIPGWERWVRSHYDREPDLRFVITGSSAGLVASDLSTLLTGRTLTFTARPLSFPEFLSFAGLEVSLGGSPREILRASLARRVEIAHHLARYLETGGFPEVVKSDDAVRRRLLLQQYFGDILARDVARRHAVRNYDQLRDLALLLLANVANLAAYGSLGRVLGTSASSVRTLCGHLEQAHLVAQVRLFAFSLKETVAAQRPRKVYAIDTGLRNAVVSRSSPDLGRLAENLVFQHLASAGEAPRYWKDVQEVDFVVGRAPPVPINVTFGDEIPDRERNGLATFFEKHKAREGWLVTRDMASEETLGRGKVHVVPLWAWLLGDPSGFR